MGNATINQHAREMRDGHLAGDLTGELRSLGYHQTVGRSFPVRAGLLVLRRRSLYPTPGPWRICGVAETGAATIRNRAAYTHGASTGWQYSAAHVFGNGQVGAWSKPIRVDFDGAGDRITPALPMWPIELAAEPVAGGKARVTWSYDAWGQGGWPTDFAVYIGFTKDTISYVTPVGTVAFDLQARHHELTTVVIGDGIQVAFSVRARNSGGVAETNTFTTDEMITRLTGPTDATVQMATPRRRGGVGR